MANIIATIKKDGEPVGRKQFYFVSGCIIIDYISVRGELEKGDVFCVYCHATDKTTGKKHDRKNGIYYDGISLETSIAKGEQELRDWYDARPYLKFQWRNLDPCKHF